MALPRASPPLSLLLLSIAVLLLSPIDLPVLRHHYHHDGGDAAAAAAAGTAATAAASWLLHFLTPSTASGVRLAAAQTIPPAQCEARHRLVALLPPLSDVPLRL